MWFLWLYSDISTPYERRFIMKKILLTAGLAVFLCAGIAGAGEFTLKSDQIGGQMTMDQVYSGFGCSGKNISPELKWINAPKNTKSFAVTVYDPAAPTGSGWWHWVIFNIPANATELVTDAGDPQKHLAPKGSVQSMTDFGKPGFGGPCPPQGDKAHPYIFTVFALDVPALDLNEKANAALVGFMLNAHAIEKASLISYYGR
jgi:Raf kinase inhibitor-like YbhB/YbcL family protein